MISWINYFYNESFDGHYYSHGREKIYGKFI